ncbi:MAG: hypothetical protein ACE5L7_05430 [Candidatus Aminicenantales bacterium]
MKGSKVSRSKKTLAAALVLLVAVLVFLPLQSDAGVCEDAAMRCAVDAILISIFTGVSTGLVFTAFCAFGYEWCLRYFE